MDASYIPYIIAAVAVIAISAIWFTAGGVRRKSHIIAIAAIVIVAVIALILYGTGVIALPA